MALMHGGRMQIVLLGNCFLAASPLCELLACSNSHVASDDASTSLAGIHTFASLAANSLAAVPGLKEPMGEAGAIQALVNIVRRCGQSSVMCVCVPLTCVKAPTCLIPTGLEVSMSGIKVKKEKVHAGSNDDIRANYDDHTDDGDGDDDDDVNMMT
eukprot:scaffold71543_cov17-Tisochrysis_lutea.AAC.1